MRKQAAYTVAQSLINPGLSWQLDLHEAHKLKALPLQNLQLAYSVLSKEGSNEYVRFCFG
jgi:hypothetical protein